ncbi:MAG: hypothetical protein U9Q40_03140 [Campylobacterota bacterium]|nr:hypothetical protein [Campylobacterota bacterium]
MKLSDNELIAQAYVMIREIESTDPDKLLKGLEKESKMCNYEYEKLRFIDAIELALLDHEEHLEYFRNM